MKEEVFNKWFNVFILAGMSVAIILAAVFTRSSDEAAWFLLFVSAFGSLMGVASTVASANGKIITFLFGFLDVSIYGVICFLNWRNTGTGLGNCVLHLAYFVPMQFVGYRQWKARSSSDAGSGLKARRFNKRQALLCTAGFLLLTVVCYIVINAFDHSAAEGFIKVAVLLDVIPLACNIIGQLLMSVAFMEQWIFWIGVNVFSILMWVFSLKAGGEDYALIYIIKYVFYLINSFNGLRIWIGLSKPGGVCK